MSLLKENILYHYTDFTALDGILSNSELRLNNVLNMNDASEMLLFILLKRPVFPVTVMTPLNGNDTRTGAGLSAGSWIS